MRTPMAYFVKELRLINPDLSVAWNNKIKRWCIYNLDGSISHIVQHPKTQAYRDLDQRILRKLRIDTYFTRNDAALQHYMESQNPEHARQLRQYLNRGVDGISDYLSGWDTED